MEHCESPIPPPEKRRSRAKTPDEAIAGPSFTMTHLLGRGMGVCAPPTRPKQRARKPASPPERHPKPRRREQAGTQAAAAASHGVGAIAGGHGDVVWGIPGTPSVKYTPLMLKFQPKKTIWIYRFDALFVTGTQNFSAKLLKDGQLIATVTVQNGATSGSGTPQGGQVEVPPTSTLSIEITNVDRGQPGTTVTLIARVAS